MKRSQSLVAALASVAIGAGVIALAAVGLASAQPHNTPLVATVVGDHHDAFTISEYPDSLFSNTVHGPGGGAHPNWVSWSDPNIVVHAHSLVTVTVKGYDGGGPLNNTFFANVMGTVGNTETVNGVTVSNIDPQNVAHTFTIRGVPGTDQSLFVSAPIPVNPSNDTPVTIGAGQYPKPITVTFSFYTKGPGVYQWNCEYPCGSTRLGQFGGAMSTYTYMSGTFKVI